MDFADWFLYDHGPCQERVKEKFLKKKTISNGNLWELIEIESLQRAFYIVT